MGDKQKMQSLSLAFAQMSSTGKLTGQDLLQMINAGFNPLNEISKMTGKSVAVLKEEMSNNTVNFTIQLNGNAYKALVDLDEVVGKVTKMLIKQSRHFLQCCE